MAFKNGADGFAEVNTTTQGTDGHQAQLHADADLSRPESVKVIKAAGKAQTDPEDDFVQKEKAHLRTELHLPDGHHLANGNRATKGHESEAVPEASSQQVYQAIADSMKKNFHLASPELKREVLTSLGLTRAEFLNDNKENQTIYNAVVMRERVDYGQILKQRGIDPGSATLEQLEEARARDTYRKMKAGKLPIDPD